MVSLKMLGVYYMKQCVIKAARVDLDQCELYTPVLMHLEGLFHKQEDGFSVRFEWEMNLILVE